MRRLLLHFLQAPQFLLDFANCFMYGFMPYISHSIVFVQLARRKGSSMLAQVHRPVAKPVHPNFSSGPCQKRPGWSLQALDGAVLGRSHRSKEGKAKLREVVSQCVV